MCFFAVGERQEEGVPALLPDLPIAFHPAARPPNLSVGEVAGQCEVKTLVEEKQRVPCLQLGGAGLVGPAMKSGGGVLCIGVLQVVVGLVLLGIYEVRWPPPPSAPARPLTR